MNMQFYLHILQLSDRVCCFYAEKAPLGCSNLLSETAFKPRANSEKSCKSRIIQSDAIQIFSVLTSYQKSFKSKNVI